MRKSRIIRETTKSGLPAERWVSSDNVPPQATL
jgi:hypothetical protein